MRSTLFVSAVVALLVFSAPALAQQDGGWPSWRGADGSGAAAGTPPTSWSEDSNVVWKTSMPGDGTATPIVWKGKVYVTAVVKTDRKGEPKEKRGESSNRRRSRRGGRRGRFGGGSGSTDTYHEFLVLAYDANSGKELWRREVANEVPHEGTHGTGSLAASSVLTDGEALYAFFGSRGIHCLDMDGEVKWSKDLGTMWTRNSFGEGASPTVYGDTLIVNWDHERDSFIVAFNKKTGKELWRTDRDESTTWGTPQVAVVGGKPQVIITGTRASRAYNLKTGKLIWSVSGMTGNCIPSPIIRDGVAYLMSGFRGSSFQAIRLKGAKGKLDDSKNLLWEHNQGTSYVPSALLYDDNLYFLRVSSAVLTCLDAKTGKAHYEGERLSGMRTVYASPVGAGGHVYITSRQGVTKVLKAGAKPEVVATNELDDTIDGSAAVVGDRIYLRGRKNLYCIGSTTGN